MKKSEELGVTKTLEIDRDQMEQMVGHLESISGSVHETINVNRTHFGPISKEGTLKSMTLQEKICREEKNSLSQHTSIQLQGSADTEHAFEVEVGVPIGEGGFSTIYSAQQKTLRREVAIKIPHSGRATQKHKNILVEEALRMAQLEHPNIMPVYSLGYDNDGNPILLMKKIEGVTWLDIIIDEEHSFWEEQTGDPLRVHLKILIQVCHALEYAHSKSIIHRDIKAANVMIGSFGEVYLLDWGIAAELDDSGVYVPPSFCGTPVCAAPEMVIPSFPLDIKTDVYLLGSLLHRILTKEERHKGSNLLAIFSNICTGEVYQYPLHIHPILASICQKANATLSTERYENVRQFREEIERFLQIQETLILLEKSQHKLALFELEVQADQPNEYKIHQYAFQCRFGFQNVIEKDPTLKKAQDLLVKSIILHFRFEIQQGQLNIARRILKELQELAVADDMIVPLQEELQSEEERRQRSNELATQIQYKLLEQIQQLKKG